VHFIFLSFMKRIGILIYFLFSCGLLSAQQLSDVVGQIIDQQLKFPVAFATIQLEQQESGVVADENGYFRIPASLKKTKETLRISAIGFESKSLQLLKQIPSTLYLK